MIKVKSYTTRANTQPSREESIKKLKKHKRIYALNNVAGTFNSFGTSI